MSIFSGKDPNWVAKRGTVTNGLVGHWDSMAMSAADRAGNRWLDISGNNNHGTLVGGASFDRIGCNFDGVNDYISVSSTPFNNTTQTTISYFAWFYVRSGYGISALYNGSAGFLHYAGASVVGQRLYIGSTPFPALNSNTFLTVNKWHHIGFTYNNKAITFYLNGSPDGNATGINDPSFGTANLLFGGFGSSETLNGFQDDIRLYNRALSAAEILRNFNATRARFGV